MTSAAMTISTTEFRAAGTDLSERRRSGLSQGPLIDIAATPDTSGIEWAADGAGRIGGLTTIEAIATDARLAAAYPGLTTSARRQSRPALALLVLSQSAYRLPEEGRRGLSGPRRQSSLSRGVRPRPLRRSASLDYGRGVAGV